MSRRETAIERLLKRGLLRVDGALMNEEMHPFLGEFGYTMERIQEGKSVLDTAERIVMRHRQAQTERSEALQGFREAWRAASAHYRMVIKVSRVALRRQPELWTALALSGARAEGLGGWLAQARQLYTNALASKDVQQQLLRFNITQEKLEDGLRLVEDVERKAVQREHADGEAQQLTVERDLALDELDDWLDDFEPIARLALEEQPQWLEKLGIVAP